MIGQKNNLDKIFQWKLNKSLPRFILIIGEKGSGRLTLAKAIAKSISCTPVIIGNSVDDVRETIRSSYTVQETTMYIFRNTDAMRAEAKNALLKVTEEPPNNAYFIMTLEKESNTLETIISRSVQLQIEPYTLSQLLKYTDSSTLVEYCSNIGQIKEWQERGDVDEFIKFTNDISDNLKSMYGTDILQISKKLKCKETETGYDCVQFVKTLYKMLPVNKEIARITTQCINDLQRVGIKKSSTIDLYLLELKELLSLKT